MRILVVEDEARVQSFLKRGLTEAGMAVDVVSDGESALQDARSAPYDAIVLASADLAEEHPEVIEALRPLIGAIDADAMQRMNLAVDREGASAGAVARRLLGALKTEPPPRPGSP